MSRAFDLAVVAGSFHVPAHEALAAVRQALALAPKVVLALTGARMPRSPRHPFTWEERAALLGELLADSPRAGIAVEPLREWWDDGRNARELAAAAARHAAPNARIGLLRMDDALAVPAGWTLQDLHDVQARQDDLLALLHGAETPELALSAIGPQVPPAVQAFLAAFLRTPDSARLREEARHIAREKEEWSVAPYPVVLVTVDAVVRAAGHVLLIRRGRHPGQGLDALPGGFLDPRETVLAAAMRELKEETLLPLSDAQLRACLKDRQVFDDPRRSQRGRVVTHAHFFDLPLERPPPVRGGDDAAAARWVPQQGLPALEDHLIDDHLMILNRFLGFLDAA